MTREKIPVMLRHVDGAAYELGHVSRVTRSCLSAFMHRVGYDAIHKLGCPQRTFEFVRGNGPGVRAESRDGLWAVTLAR